MMINFFQRLTTKQKHSLIESLIIFILLVAGYFLPNQGLWKLFYYLILYVIIGYPVIKEACEGLIKGKFFGESFLMVIATVGAFFVHQYPEAVAVMLFFQVGELFSHVAAHNSRKAIHDLLDLRPEVAHVLRAGQFVTVEPNEVKIGDVIKVSPGERIPLDGVVMAGNAYLDTAALTGESKPRFVEPGAEVLSGSIVENSVLEIEVNRDLQHSTVSRIMDLVENANDKKAHTEKFIRRFAKIYTPIVVFLAIALAIIPWTLGFGPFHQWLTRALIFLVISCPCALVISVPLGFFGGIGAASRVGALVKGSNYLEALTEVKTVVFDKTGTLTKGSFTVVETLPHQNKISADELLELAAIAEQFSPHPIANSIVAAYQKPITVEVLEVKEIVGQGVSVMYAGAQLLVGNRKLLMAAKIMLPELPASTVGSMVYVAYQGEYQGALEVADTLKEDAIQAMSDLKSVGVTKVVMLTGDNRLIGETVATQLGIDQVKTELLPQDKLFEVEQLENELSPHEKLAFVGDGLNDTPVLTRADIGIAMGDLGSDAAIEAADVVLMSDEPSAVAKVIKVAKRTKQIVIQNIVMALGFKILFLLLATFGLANMWEAVFADVGVAILAIANSMRLLKPMKFNK